MDTQSTDPATFLRAVLALYDDDLPTTQRIGICTMTPQGDVRQHLRKTPELAAKMVHDIGTSLHCYFETCTNPVKITGKRLSAKEAKSTGNVHLDIDFASPHRKKGGKLPATEADALAVLAPLWELLPPSLTVFSGYGLQVYWCFREPADLTDDKERKECKTAANALHNFYKQLMTKAGYQVDNVTDLARLMRIPGGWNIKNPDDPRRVTFVDHGPRYNLSDIIDELPDVPEEKPSDVVEVDASPLAIDPSVVLRQIDGWRDISPEIDTAWRCKRKTGDTSLSGQVQSFISGVCANDPDKLIPDAYLRFAIEEFYRRHGRDNAHKAKGRRKDFQDRTIRLARSSCLVARTQTGATSELEECNAQVNNAAYEGGRDAAANAAKEVAPQMFEALSKQIGCRVIAVKKYMTQPATYIVETNMGNVPLGNTETMMRRMTFQARLMEITGRVVDLKRKEHLVIVQAILNAAEQVDLGPEATETGIVTAHIRRYLEGKTIQDDAQAAMDEGFMRPFWHKGRICFRLERLTEYLTQNRFKFEEINLPCIMRQAGFERVDPKVTDANGRRTVRTCWASPVTLEIDPLTARRTAENPFNGGNYD